MAVHLVRFARICPVQVSLERRPPLLPLRTSFPTGCSRHTQLSIAREFLEDRYVADVARDRLAAIRSGEEDLIPEEDFWAQADGIMARRK